MKLAEMIEDLRSKGYVVRIDHQRCTNLHVDGAMKRRAQGRVLAQPVRYFSQREFPDPMGSRAMGMSVWAGRTVATIATPKVDGDGFDIVAQGVAVCSPLDSYVRYTGAIKALGRAVSQLQERPASLPNPTRALS